MLVFRSQIGRPASAGGPPGNALDGVKPFLVGPAEIIRNRLAKVIAVGKGLARDFSHATIDRFDLGPSTATAANSFPVATEFSFQHVLDLLGLYAACAPIDPTSGIIEQR